MNYFLKICLTLFVFFVFNSCMKENAKHEYVFTMKFSNGDEISNQFLICEKLKHYNIENAPLYNSMKSNPNLIYLVFQSGLNDKVRMYQDITLIKTNDSLTREYINNFIRFTPSSILGNGTDISAIGKLELKSTFKRRFRKIIVENGTFTYEWQNAEDYGQTDQTLTGTWTLKRE